MRKKMRLGDIATLITKGTTPTSVGYNFTDTGVNFVKIESIREDGTFIPDKFAHISDECNTKLKRSQLQENDILFSIAGAIGRTAIVTKDCLPANTNQALAIIRIPQGVIDYRFLLYALQSDAIIEQAEKQKQGVAQLNLSLQNINDFEIPFFTEEEQLTVVEVLSSVDSLLSTRIAQLEQLDELVKSRFIELFCDCQKHTNIKESGLTISDGNYSSKYPRSEEFVESGIPFIRANNLKNGTVVDEDMYFITPQKHAILIKGHLKPNDVLITTRGNIGQVAIVPNKHNDSNINAQIVLLRDDNNRFVPQYLLWALQTEEAKSQYIELQTGTALKQLPVGRLEQVVIKEPPIELQKHFATFVEQTDKSKLAVQQSIAELEELKKSLMQKYFG